ncbi:alpha/beta fold hydrolase [Actinokineospora sp.]|uniref:alpha/beta fold hydrolase n=1 Tax=Actinokineospora sp. TaxID=1872133 RepID=UPI004037A848
MSDSLHVHTFGPEDAAPLLALHGITGHGGRYRRLAEHQLAGRRVLAPDLRGHGRSPRLPPWTLEQHAADLLAVLDAHRLDSVPVVGHSFGALVAIHLARLAPQRVRKLVLLDPAVSVRPADALAWAETPVKTCADRAEALATQRNDWPDAVDPELIEEEVDANWVPITRATAQANPEQDPAHQPDPHQTNPPQVTPAQGTHARPTQSPPAQSPRSTPPHATPPPAAPPQRPTPATLSQGNSPQDKPPPTSGGQPCSSLSAGGGGGRGARNLWMDSGDVDWRPRYCPAAVTTAWSEMCRATRLPPPGTPTLVVRALREAFVGPEFLQACKVELGADFTLVDLDSGHMVYLEEPDQVARLIDGFLE